MQVNLTMAVVFGVMVAFITILYLLSRKKYDDFIEPVEEKDFRMKKLMPMALFLMDSVKYSNNTRYDRKLLMKISELYGVKYSQYYLRVHWANKIGFFILALLILSVFGMSIGPDTSFIVFAVILLGALFYFTDNELNEKVTKRRLSIQMDFPDFLNKLTLLVNAGMTVPRAWEKIVSDNKKDTVLYNELGIVLTEIKAGKPENQAYEDFAKRCRIQEITKFISVIIQNMRKGNAELVSILRLQATGCWEMRKHAVKRVGEEASTKLLLPMMIMFVAILIIVAIPAVLSMRGI